MDQIPELARLDFVQLRDAWPHEALSFTPWLVQNLDRLSEVIGIPLEAEGCEVSVDSFSADILARNTLDDTRVLVENQLEISDHTHLGQILTYLAGLDAHTVVWVARDFREPHLAAIKWLNEHTHEHFAFFAVRVKVARIGDSALAPVFEVLGRPNNWERRISSTTQRRESNSEITQSRADFWSEYVSRTPGEVERSGPPARTSNRWHVLEDVGLVISMYLYTEGVGLFVRGLRGIDPQQVRHRLDARRTDLESALGCPIGDGPDSFLSASLSGDPRNPGDRPRLQDWLAERRARYEEVLRATMRPAV